MLLSAARRGHAAQHPAVWVRQRLLTHLTLLYALGVGVHLVLQALLLHLGLRFQLLV